MWGFHFCMYFTASLFLFLSPVFAEIDVDTVSESIVRVRAYKNDKVIAEGSGFVVNGEGHVLTNAHLLEDAKRLTVLSLKTGAELLSQKVFARRDMNLALLRAQGLGLPPLSLSEQGADVGRFVYTLKFGAKMDVQSARGTIGAYLDRPGKKVRDPVVHVLQHNALVTSKAFGMPLFNECGDVVAINLPDPSGRWPFRKNKEPSGTIFALRSGDIMTALRDRKIAHTVVAEECLSAVERAERDRKIAEARIKAEAEARIKAERDSAQALAKAARDSTEAERAARLVAEREKARADSANKAAADSIKAAQDSIEVARLALERAKAREDSLKQAARDSIDAQKAAADSIAIAHQQEQTKTSQRLHWSIVAGASLVLLVLVGWLVFAQRKRAQLRSASQEAEAARQAAAQAPQPAPFRCMLRGQDNMGKEFALNIPALALGASAGVTLGRSPNNAEFIIDHEAVSRNHLRLTYTEGDLHVEDLNATNGTKVNGQLLNSGEQVVLQNNAQLEVGPIVFQVSLIQE